MGITVEDLLDLPHLALELIAGSAGLGSAIRWAHVTEVEDPTPWLEGGELILTTGLGLPPNASGQVAYLKRLARAEVGGVVIVADSAPPLTAELLEAAEQLGLPLITTLLKQPFQAISKVVFSANSDEQAERVAKHLRIYGVLRKAGAEGAQPAEVLARLSRLTGMRLAVVREDGRPQFEPGPVDPRWPEAEAALKELGTFASRGLHVRLAGGDRFPPAFVIQVDAASQSRIFLLAEGLNPTAVPDLVALHHIATVVSAQVLSQRAERAIRQKLGAELLAEIVGDEVPVQSAEARLEALKIPTAGLVVAVATPPQGVAAQLTEALHDALLDHDIPALVMAQGSRLVLLAGTLGSEDMGARTLARVAASVVGDPSPIGVGTPGSVTHVRTSYQEALVAHAHAQEAGGTVSHFRTLGWGRDWLPAEPERLDLMIERTVTPIMSYDEAHGSDLLRSLRAFLANNRSPATAARVLDVHRNTLAYRLRRIEEITGRSLRSIDDQVELWIGLRILEVRARVEDGRRADAS